MTIIPEETLLKLLRTCLRLSERALEAAESARATDPAPAELVDAYGKFIHELHEQKRNDTTLADQSWEWIWEVKPDLNALQIYGRLAWVNYTLFDLL